MQKRHKLVPLMLSVTLACFHVPTHGLALGMDVGLWVREVM
uniref:Uncharacterized protein n=1 Tax=Anguilla anguilla TaxID=7936 RepID=A0A0E9SQM8_ANGAN